MKKEIPILFKTPMVQSILDSRKTNTRRTHGLELINENPDYYEWLKEYSQLDIPRQAKKFDDRHYYAFTGRRNNSTLVVTHCPYGKPGDVLWVRESWRGIQQDNGSDRYEYRADEKINLYEKWKPAIHMPKAAARIWLEVKNVRPERLHDISDKDAIAEGIELVEYNCFKNYDEKNPYQYLEDPIGSFRSLWQSINGPESWEANPWVWVVKFKVLSPTGKPLFKNLKHIDA